MANWVNLNGQLLEEEKAFLHYRDLAFQRGYGIFDFFRLVGNEPLFLADHLDRFYQSAEGMHLPVEIGREALKELIFNLIQINNLPGSGIRLSLTGGCSVDGFNLGKPNLLVSQHGFTPPTSEQREAGIKLMSYSYQRQLPHIKSIDYLMAVWLQPLRMEKGADDILYHDDGLVTECPRNNFFIVNENGTIVTPAEGALMGITRKKVLELARQYYKVEERAVSMDEVKRAKEAFITSTTKQVLPVRQVDEVVFETRKVGRHLQGLFEEVTGSGGWLIG